jgi:hypothetical protein
MTGYFQWPAFACLRLQIEFMSTRDRSPTNLHYRSLVFQPAKVNHALFFCDLISRLGES